jgi:hypothetical protein
MDVKKAKSVEMVTPKYGFAIYETDWKGNPCEPTVHFLIKNIRKDGSVWYQQTPGWYVSTLLEREPHCKDLHDPNEVGLYIDYGQNWFIPAGPYSMMWDYLEEYSDNNGAESICYHDSKVLNGEVW